MNIEEFLEWLKINKNMSLRSAKDVLSRYSRICKMLNLTDFNNDTLSLLTNCKHFNQCSMFVKSQLKRTITLYLEFKNQ